MSRWESNARGRLEKAALDLYTERGFEQTTVAEIAERAGLTERTFFRHFANKREVLFWGQSRLQEIAANAVASQPETATPITLVVAGLEAMAAAIPDRPEFTRQLHAVIAANPELQERGLLKTAALGAVLAESLQKKGIDSATAQLLAETGMAVFKVASARWAVEAGHKTFLQLIRETLAELKTVFVL